MSRLKHIEPFGSSYWPLAESARFMPLNATIARFLTARRIGMPVALLPMLLIAPGCDSSSFVPPPPAELIGPGESDLGPSSGGGAALSPTFSTSRKDVTKRAVGTARIVELILARKPD